jgi:hypothetical protein
VPPADLQRVVVQVLEGCVWGVCVWGGGGGWGGGRGRGYLPCTRAFGGGGHLNGGLPLCGILSGNNNAAAAAAAALPPPAGSGWLQLLALLKKLAAIRLTAINQSLSQSAGGLNYVWTGRGNGYVDFYFSILYL